jgi:hypothetical protein
MNWPTAAVLIALLFTIMVIVTTSLTGRFSKR